MAWNTPHLLTSYTCTCVMALLPATQRMQHMQLVAGSHKISCMQHDGTLQGPNYSPNPNETFELSICQAMQPSHPAVIDGDPMDPQRKNCPTETAGGIDPRNNLRMVAAVTARASVAPVTAVPNDQHSNAAQQPL